MTTAPATPVPARSSETIASALIVPVPIIAPPVDHIASLPLSPETLAKVRLTKFLDREKEQRRRDGLIADISAHPPGWIPETHEDNCDDNQNLNDDSAASEWEADLRIGKLRRLGAINWILDVRFVP